jgi:hypothetical protein
VKVGSSKRAAGVLVREEEKGFETAHGAVRWMEKAKVTEVSLGPHS